MPIWEKPFPSHWCVAKAHGAWSFHPQEGGGHLVDLKPRVTHVVLFDAIELLGKGPACPKQQADHDRALGPQGLWCRFTDDPKDHALQYHPAAGRVDSVKHLSPVDRVLACHSHPLKC